MTQPVHGHEVIQMLLRSDRALTRGELLRAIDERFGAGVRFYTCSEEDLSPEGLIDFLEARGKFAPATDGSLSIDPQKISRDD